MLERLKQWVMTPLPDRLWMAHVAIAACLTVAGIAPFLLVLLLLAWNRRERLAVDLRDAVDRHERWFPIAITLIVPALALYRGGFPPQDDLLRHVAAASIEYDYRQLYIGLDPSFPQSSMWFGFEVAAGWLAGSIGYWPAVYTIQGLCYALAAMLAIVLARKLIHADQESKATWMTVAVTALLLGGLLQRSLLARPEAFMALWGISAVVLRPAAWVGIGLLLMPAYWLSAVYLPCSLLLRASGKTRLAAAAALAAVYVVFWAVYAGTDWMQFAKSLLLMLDSRVEHAAPGEALPIQAALLNPIFVLAIGAALLRGRNTAWRHADLLCVLVIAWFLLPGQIRYIGIVGVLLIILAIPRIPTQRLPLSGRLAVPVICALLVAANAPAVRHGDLPTFELAPGSRLLTEFDAPTYLLPAINPGIRSAPAMDMGAVDPRLQMASLALSGWGRLDCRTLHAFGITHVVESRMATSPDCLESPVFKPGTPWRMWHVRDVQ